MIDLWSYLFTIAVAFFVVAVWVRNAKGWKRKAERLSLKVESLETLEREHETELRHLRMAVYLAKRDGFDVMKTWPTHPMAHVYGWQREEHSNA